MQIRRVYSKNADFQRFEVLKTNRNKRFRNGEFLVEGVRNLNYARQYGWTFSALLFPGETSLSAWAMEMIRDIPTEVRYQLAPTLMAEISGKSEASELLGIVQMRNMAPDLRGLPGRPLLALMDRPSNRGNLGTIIRSCDALGVHQLWVTGHGVDIYDPEVVVSTMGSFFRMPVFHIPETQQLLQYISLLKASHPGFLSIGTSAHAPLPLDQQDLSGPLLFCLGNETDGLSRALQESCDVMVQIPMDDQSSASSLNVGCAATVLFYEARRQRGFFSIQ